ncbi:hypothetical protein ACFL1X_13250 [Candidatus Hydrogenedentota bacterium]
MPNVVSEQMIAVIISANTEWRVIKKRFPDMHVQSSPFGKWCEIVLDDASSGKEVLLFHGGWGKVRAAASTQFVIDKFSPELLINIGTCGGFEGHVSPGDILLAEKTIIYDIHERMFDPENAIEHFSTDLDLVWIDEIPKNVKRSLLVSGDSDLDPGMIGTLRDKYNAIAGDWESGAIAHVCQLNKVRCLILRGVSDLVSESDGEAYQDPGIFAERAGGIMNNLLDSLPIWIDMHKRNVLSGRPQ